MKQSEIAVSIVCNAYNHEKYIRNALEGFVMQKTNFRFEVLIHDDASTDHTSEIIREYELKYPEIIKPIYETENQYSKKDGSLTRIQYGRVQGKYIAMCEGDDYWIDPLKLQKQFDALEAHPELDICAHGAYAERNGEKCGKILPSKKATIFSPSQVIFGGGGFVGTASIMYRASLEKEIPLFRQFIRLDYTLQIHGSLRGGMLFLPDIMSVYRCFTFGSWTETMKRNPEKYKKHCEKITQMLDMLDQETNEEFHEAIERRKMMNEVNNLILSHDYQKLKQKCYRPIVRQKTKKDQIKIFIYSHFPFVLTLKYGTPKH